MTKKMKLISPRFLCKINEIYERQTIFCALFDDFDIISIVMKEKNLNFHDACEWISRHLYKTEAPEATDSEKCILKIVANEYIDSWKPENDQI